MAPHDPSRVSFAQARGMVQAIWSELGLRYPPEVLKLPRQATRTVARANRLALYVPEEMPAWCLLHELAHALSSTAEGTGDGHGPIFVGLYMQLLERYLRLDRASLRTSLREARIAVEENATPIFLSSDAARGGECVPVRDRMIEPGR